MLGQFGTLWTKAEVVQQRGRVGLDTGNKKKKRKKKHARTVLRLPNRNRSGPCGKGALQKLLVILAIQPQLGLELLIF